MKTRNPRMTNPDGVFAAEAMRKDYFSLRDHFAGLAMQGILSSMVERIANGIGIDESERKYISSLAYSISDDMLRESEK